MENKETGGPSTIALSIRRTLYWLIAATVVLYLGVAGLTIFVWSQSAKNTDALCSVRHDAERRVQQAQQFLVDNPKGIPGIPVSLLQQTINTSQSTVNSLAPLHCPPLQVTPNQ